VEVISSSVPIACSVPVGLLSLSVNQFSRSVPFTCVPASNAVSVCRLRMLAVLQLPQPFFQLVHCMLYVGVMISMLWRRLFGYCVFLYLVSEFLAQSCSLLEDIGSLQLLFSSQ
jgi:hypothetical protein